VGIHDNVADFFEVPTIRSLSEKLAAPEEAIPELVQGEKRAQVRRESTRGHFGHRRAQNKPAAR
jgi:hypothetical protein